VTQSDGGSGLVWTVDDGRLKRQRVALGARTLDSRIEVKNSEARIVSAVVPGLAEGRRVRIAGE
jgi:hypothetical protein